MANTVFTTADYQNAVADVVTALRGGDFSGARVSKAIAQAIHLALPQESTTAGNHTVKNRVEELSALDAAIDTAERAAGGAPTTLVGRINFGGRR